VPVVHQLDSSYVSPSELILGSLMDAAQSDTRLRNPVEMSRWAWANRFSALPTTVSGVLTDVRADALGDDDLGVVFGVCARRLQYGFAHQLVRLFVSEARTVRGGTFSVDPFLNALDDFAACCQGDDRWEQLLAGALTGEHVAQDLAMTAGFVAGFVPQDVLEALLAILDNQRGTCVLAPVSAYRRVNFLRRLGRSEQAMAACDEAFAALLTGRVDAALADHLSERLVIETLLLQRDLEV
jgi:hypothetical protein